MIDLPHSGYPVSFGTPWHECVFDYFPLGFLRSLSILTKSHVVTNWLCRAHVPWTEGAGLSEVSADFHSSVVLYSSACSHCRTAVDAFIEVSYTLFPSQSQWLVLSTNYRLQCAVSVSCKVIKLNNLWFSMDVLHSDTGTILRRHWTGQIKNKIDDLPWIW